MRSSSLPSYWSAFWTSRFPFSELIEGLRDPCQHHIRIQGSTPLSPNLTHGYWCEVTQKVREWHLYSCQAYFCGFPWPVWRVLLLHLPVVKHHVTFQPKVAEIFQSNRVFPKVRDLLTLLLHCCLQTHLNWGSWPKHLHVKLEQQSIRHLEAADVLSVKWQPNITVTVEAFKTTFCWSSLISDLSVWIWRLQSINPPVLRPERWCFSLRKIHLHSGLWSSLWATYVQDKMDQWLLDGFSSNLAEISHDSSRMDLLLTLIIP